MTIHSSRWQFSLRLAGNHLLMSLPIAMLSGFLVFLVWYPEPWRQILGVASIFVMVMIVNVVCGPMLTFVLANPLKSIRMLVLDLSLVALIQVIALGYGMWSVFLARPVAVVFEVDRFVLVTANEVLIDELREAPPTLRSLPWSGVRLFTVRQAQTQAEHLRSLELSLQGVTPAMRPAFWRPFEEAQIDFGRASKPLTELISKRPAQRDQLVKAAAMTGVPNADLRYVPLTSSKDLEWVTLLNVASDIVGYAPVDGFDE